MAWWTQHSPGTRNLEFLLWRSRNTDHPTPLSRHHVGTYVYVCTHTRIHRWGVGQIGFLSKLCLLNACAKAFSLCLSCPLPCILLIVVGKGLILASELFLKCSAVTRQLGQVRFAEHQSKGHSSEWCGCMELWCCMLYFLLFNTDLVDMMHPLHTCFRGGLCQPMPGLLHSHCPAMTLPCHYPSLVPALVLVLLHRESLQGAVKLTLPKKLTSLS